MSGEKTRKNLEAAFAGLQSHQGAFSDRACVISAQGDEWRDDLAVPRFGVFDVERRMQRVVLAHMGRDTDAAQAVVDHA